MIKNLKKGIISAYIIFLLITAGFAGLLVFEAVVDEGSVSAVTTRYVGTGQTYTKIQDAIDNASIGDTVRVYAGTYYENVIVNKTVTLIGNGSSNTIIDGGGIGDVDGVKITVDWVNVTGFKIINSGIHWNNAGIKLNNVKNCHIYNNNLSFHDWHGICLEYSTNNTIINNTCSSNTYIGINLYFGSNNNKLDNNICNSNGISGIILDRSSSNTLVNNTCLNNDLGIDLWSSSSNKVLNNTMIGGSIGISGNWIDYWNTHEIDSTNTVNGNPVYYWKNATGGVVPLDAGQVILANCTNVIVKDQDLSNGGGIGLGFSTDNTIKNNTCSNNSSTIYLFYSSSNTLENNTCNSNNYHGIGLGRSSSNTLDNNICNSNIGSGIYLDDSSSNTIVNNICSNNKNGITINSSSSDNIFENCSISSNSPYDFFLNENSENNIEINSTFSTINVDSTSEFFCKNYLHIQINDYNGLPIQNADVQVKDNYEIIYATPGYYGIDQTTDVQGQVRWIIASDKVYDGSNTPTKRTTTVNVGYNGLIFRDNNRDVNMSTSHFEYFDQDILPNKTTLQYPINNSFITDPTPQLTWNATNDGEDDTLTYFIELDEIGSDWSWLVYSNYTLINELNCEVQPSLDDGDYQWRVCAYDGFGNGIWSDVWKFGVDTETPLANKPFVQGKYSNISTVNWSWSPTKDTGSGILGYYVSIGTNPDCDNLLYDVWTTNTWYEESGLGDDRTYYCKIKAQNGAVTMSDYSENSDGIFIDTDLPAVYTPNAPGKYNNTGIVNWTWTPSPDTGSGITGYYVCIGTTPGGIEVINDNFVTNTWYELSGLSNGITYYCKIKAKNGAGTISGYSDNSNSIIIDTSPPTKVSILINDDNEYTNLILVTLSITAEDTGSLQMQMAFSTDNIIWTSSESFGETKTFYLSEGDGEKFVYLKVSDGVGNIALATDKIILDTASPHFLSITINDGASKTTSTEVELKLNALDDTSGVYQMAFSNDGISWSSWEPFKSASLHTLPAGEGEIYVYFKTKDRAGNIATDVSDTIILVRDIDGDGMPNDWEDAHGLNMNLNDAMDDLDKDGLINIDEYNTGTDPQNPDTDNDGLSDGEEINILKTNATNPDTDGDGHDDGSDAYPLDFAKWQKEKVDKKGDTDDSSGLWIIIVIVVVIVVVLLALLFVMKRKKGVKSDTLQITQEELEAPPETPIEQPPAQTPPDEILREMSTEQPQVEAPLEVPQEETSAVDTPLLEAPPEVMPEPIYEPIVPEPTTELPPDAYVQQQPQEPTMATPQPIDGTQEQSTTAVTPGQPQPQESEPQPLTTQCPLCQQIIQEYANPCPHCGGALEWGESS